MGILSANSSRVRTKPDSDSQAAVGKPEPQAWRSSVKNAIRSSSELRRVLELPAELPQVDCPEGTQSASFGPDDDFGFPVFAPREFVARMEKGNQADPLVLQVLPQSDESTVVDGFMDDPVGDQTATLTPGLIQKYHGRALMITTGVCAVHCRYCFRRHFPYGESKIDDSTLQLAIDQLRSDKSLDEVILSGGDPLMMTDDRLQPLVEQIAGIEHVRRLRIHTRLPVMIPSRVNGPMLDWLTGTRLTPIVVLHVNHAAELNCPDVEAAIGRLVNAGVPLLNQAVLLRGINDDTESLADLSKTLVNLRVMPYYLHLLDRVAGAAHFDVSQERGELLIEELKKILPGYAIPRLAKEAAGELSKRVIV